MGFTYTSVFDHIREFLANKVAFDRYQMACEKSTQMFDGAHRVLVISKISSEFKKQKVARQILIGISIQEVTYFKTQTL